MRGDYERRRRRERGVKYYSADASSIADARKGDAAMLASLKRRGDFSFLLLRALHSAAQCNNDGYIRERDK